MKKVEILLATYNGEGYLEQQLQSILSQDTKEWHLTVSDDGSTDSTPDILERYERDYPDFIKRVHSGKRFGNAREHFFWLMEQCKADYMQFCDQDDVWHNDKVRILQEAMEEAEQKYGKNVPMVVFSDQTVVDESLQMISPSLMHMQQQNSEATDFRNILFQSIVTGCTMEINRSMADKAAMITDSTRTVMHDWWIALIAAQFGQMVYVPVATIDYRQHGRNSVGAKDTRSLSYLLNKTFHLKRFRKNVTEKKSQAAEFLHVYESELPDETRKLLKEYSQKRSPLGFRFRYLPWITTLPRKLGFFFRW